MSRVYVELSMSLDGFIARPDDSTDEIHAWYAQGDTEVRMPNSDLVFTVDATSAELILDLQRKTGANVTGRRTFDDAGAWGGRDPYGVPSFIVSHSVPDEWAGPDSPFTFVTDGIESAITQAKKAAGERDVAVAAADLAQQCLRLGLLDELELHIAPVLLGDGVWLFDNLGDTPIALERTRVVAAPNVTHMSFRVIK